MKRSYSSPIQVVLQFQMTANIILSVEIKRIHYESSGRKGHRHILRFWCKLGIVGCVLNISCNSGHNWAFYFFMKHLYSSTGQMVL